ncbi:hypothetical protein [Bordetella tumulicola]|uniref:hypothetical protein n=1 Tax=Bordetella tumulicola TaxID=1649133 RepID=UPI0039F0C5FA
MPYPSEYLSLKTRSLPKPKGLTREQSVYSTSIHLKSKTDILTSKDYLAGPHDLSTLSNVQSDLLPRAFEALDASWRSYSLPPNGTAFENSAARLRSAAALRDSSIAESVCIARQNIRTNPDISDH